MAAPPTVPGAHGSNVHVTSRLSVRYRELTEYEAFAGWGARPASQVLAWCVVVVAWCICMQWVRSRRTKEGVCSRAPIRRQVGDGVGGGSAPSRRKVGAGGHQTCVVVANPGGRR
jgi:hypothetical protein